VKSIEPKSANVRPQRPRRNLASHFLPPATIVFVGALAVATSLPAAAFGPGSSFGMVGPSGGSQSQEQLLSVDASATDASVLRDDYTVNTPTPTPTPTPTAVPKPATAASTGGSPGGWGCQRDAPAETTRLTWPYDHPVKIGDGFGPRAEGMHDGIDMLAGDGTPIQAIGDGVVTASGYNGSAGNYVAIATMVGGQRLCSMYMHFQDGSVTVAVGQEVTAGTVIGLTGDTGNASVEHLHFELFFADGIRFDAVPYLTANASY
jgi:murein DD-endopeptidase MepM/ murein hydrolase activator NlpD